MIHSIRSRLVAGYSVIFVLFTVACAVMAVSTLQVRSGYAHAVQVDDALTAQVTLRVKLMDDEETGLRGYLLTRNPVFLEPYRRARPGLDAARSRSAILARGEPGFLPLLDRMTHRARQWESWAQGVLNQPAAAPSRRELNVSMLRGKALFDSYRQASNRLLQAMDAQRRHNLNSDLAFLDRLPFVLVGLFLAALLAVALVAWRTMSAIADPLSRLSAAAESIGRGDFAHPVPGGGDREFAELSAAMDRMRRELSSQHELAHLISSTLEIETVYETFAGYLHELVPFDRLGINLIDGDHVVTVFGTGAAVDTLPNGTRIPLTRTATARAFQTLEYAVQPDLLAVPSASLLDDERRKLEGGIRSYAIIPLIANGRVIGTLSVSSSEVGTYTRETLRETLGPALSLAPIVASAIENARLYRSLDDANEQLERLHAQAFAEARRDALTGAGNRLRLREDLDALARQSLRQGSVYSIALCDVDYFKAYNDHYGHLAGDAVLRTVAATLASFVRGGDTVYRYGGEEFLVILPGQDTASASDAAERLRLAIERLAIPHAVGTPIGNVTISCGVATMCRGDSRTVHQLLEAADGALYKAKEHGRNRVAIADNGRTLRLLRNDEDAAGS